MRIRIAMGVAIGLAGGVCADVISVPGDQPTIQAGIDAAVNGDEVVVAPGTYNEIIDFSGKAITVRSSGGAATTIIDATGVPDPGDGLPVVRFDSGEGLDSVLEGFTITGGTGDTGIFGVPVGGGVFVNGADPTVRDCIIENNICIDGGGAGVLVALGSITLDRCIIRFNQAVSGQGGGLYLSPGTSLTMTGCHLDQNSAEFHSALYADGVGSSMDIRITDTIIENHFCEFNRTTSITVPAGEVTIERCVFRNNQSPNANGGGVHILTSPLPVRVVDTVFVNNAALDGGGADIDSGPGTLIANCVFIGNTASGRGGGLDLDAPGTVLVNASFAGNQANNHSAVWYQSNQDATFENCVMWGNTGGNTIFESFAGRLTVNNSIVEGGWGGLGVDNLDVDPLFVDVVGGDLSLMPGSPAIDSGDSPAAAAVLGVTDLAGNARLIDDPDTADTGVPVFSTMIDRGAYEFGSTPAPLIEQHPESLIGTPSTLSIFLVDAPDATSFQWYFDGVPLTDGGPYSGTTTSFLVVSIGDATTEGLYSVEVSDGVRTEMSADAGLVVLPNPCPADFNEDGFLNTGDVLNFLNAFTAGCP